MLEPPDYEALLAEISRVHGRGLPPIGEPVA
jgi:hypothetical protein